MEHQKLWIRLRRINQRRASRWESVGPTCRNVRMTPLRVARSGAIELIGRPKNGGSIMSRSLRALFSVWDIVKFH
jgi:hypothetical protein